MKAKLLKCDWLMRRLFFLKLGQKLLGPDWLECKGATILSRQQKYD